MILAVDLRLGAFWRNILLARSDWLRAWDLGAVGSALECCKGRGRQSTPSIRGGAQNFPSKNSGIHRHQGTDYKHFRLITFEVSWSFNKRPLGSTGLEI